jgi:hypothetical protein
VKKPSVEGEGRKEIREVGRREGGRQVEGPVKMENQDFIWTPPQCSCCTFGWGKAELVAAFALLLSAHLAHLCVV